MPAGPAELQAADELVTSMSPSARRTYALGGTQKYELPTSEVSLSMVRSGIKMMLCLLTTYFSVFACHGLSGRRCMPTGFEPAGHLRLLTAHEPVDKTVISAVQ